MRWLSLLTAVAVLVPAVSLGQSVPTTGRYQLVGFTTTTHPGDTGVLGFTAACQAEFAGSRMCTSPEVMSTTELPSSLSGTAWVRPVIVTTSGTNSAIDVSGVVASPDNLTCKGWTNSSALTGLNVDGSGRFSRPTSCFMAIPVSCCAVIPDLSEGDVDGDGFVTAVDVAIIRRFLAGLPWSS